MSGVTTYFRHCPSCGRRFEIRLVERDLVKTEKETHLETRAGYDGASLASQRQPGLGQVRSPFPFMSDIKVRDPVELEEKVRVTVSKKEFQYHYRCKHCGHEWAEGRFVETGPRVEK